MNMSKALLVIMLSIHDSLLKTTGVKCKVILAKCKKSSLSAYYVPEVYVVFPQFALFTAFLLNLPQASLFCLTGHLLMHATL
jgi:hypothetical protein